MRLNLQKIIHVPGGVVPFSFEMDLSQEDFFGMSPVVRPVQVTGEVRNTADMLVLEGEASTVLDCTCSRCLKQYSSEKRVPLHYVLAEELEGEEDEIILLENGEIDVSDLAYEAFVFAMDTKFLCSEDCKGLCSGCGANLNEEPCRCAKKVDPRWAVLSQLLDKTE